MFKKIQIYTSNYFYITILDNDEIKYSQKNLPRKK